MKHEIPGTKVSDTAVVQLLEKDAQYKFLGIPEYVRQEERKTLESAEKTYPHRLSVIGQVHYQMPIVWLPLISVH